MTNATKQLVPKVSVAMITYNHEKFIAQAIDSVLMQKTEFQIELIIGEDCSTDGTRKIVKNYADANPHIIRTFFYPSNCGVQKNLATVLHACRGDYIACLEGDDYWTDPQKLRKQVEFMELNPNYSMCGTVVRDVLVTPDGCETESGLYPMKLSKSLFNLEDVLDEYPFRTLTFMLRNALVQLPEWFDRVPYGDMSILALYAEKGPIGCLNDVTGNYRKHNGGIFTSQSLLGQCKALGKTLDHLDTHFKGNYIKSIANRDFGFSKDNCLKAIRTGLYLEARQIYWASFRRFAVYKPFSYAILGSSILVWYPLKRRVAFRQRLAQLLKNFKRPTQNPSRP